MTILTINEYENIKLYEVDNTIYNKIDREFSKVLGVMSKAFLEKHLDSSIKELSMTSYVDVMSCFTVI